MDTHKLVWNMRLYRGLVSLYSADGNLAQAEKDWKYQVSNTLHVCSSTLARL